MISEDMLAELREGFVGEAEDLVQAVTRDLLALEKAAGPESAKLRERIARGLHTLKGSAATVGFSDAARLSHGIEDWFRTTTERVPSEALDVVLPSLGDLVANVRAGANRESDPKSLDRAIAVVSGLFAPSPAVPQERRTPQPAVETNEAPAEIAQEFWRVRASDVTLLVRELERLRELRLHLEERRKRMDEIAKALSKSGGQSQLQAQLSRLSGDLETDATELAEGVLDIETVVKAVGTLSADTLTEPLRLAAREVAREMGKAANLNVVGGDGHLERRIIEAIRGGLVQLVRNAVAHGIETPELRVQRGKHREGAITVRFEQRGNLLDVTVEDDGGGINIDRVRSVARERGHTGAEFLHDDAVAALVFEPGFSTAPVISESSGRGVGLDVVRTQIAALGGRVAVRSVSGQGTRFSAVIPVDIGASALVMVRCGEQRFGIPVSAVTSLSRPAEEELVRVRGRQHAVVRGSLQPVDRLGALLGLQSSLSLGADQVLLRLRSEGSELILSVDEVIGDESLVVRALPDEIRMLPAYQGAATLADGRLMLVLRPEWLAEQAGHSTPGPESQRILVVDDSLTARALHRTVLESGGFQVHCAGSAAHAIEQLATAKYDAIVCDIGMEGMDGVELTAHVRGVAETHALPILLVSAHDSDEERARGAAAGADAFLSKRDCISGRLVTEIRQVTARRRISA